MPDRLAARGWDGCDAGESCEGGLGANAARVRPGDDHICGDDRSDARLVEQPWCERTDVAEDLPLELLGLRRRRLDPSRERAQDELHGQLVDGTGARAAEVAAAFKQAPLGQRLQPDLYEQVAAEIRRAIADGEAKPGERLPPAKDLAAVLGVNTNTVLRSLRLLRDEGLLEFRRGRGVTVIGTPEHGAVVARAKALVEFARQNGYRRDELLELISTLS
jgi:DNA-binding transcriptional regulator YhcF (GntR family)